MEKRTNSGCAQEYSRTGARSSIEQHRVIKVRGRVIKKRGRALKKRDRPVCRRHQDCGLAQYESFGLLDVVEGELGLDAALRCDEVKWGQVW